MPSFSQATEIYCGEGRRSPDAIQMALPAGSVDNRQRKSYLFIGHRTVCKPTSASHIELRISHGQGSVHGGAAQPPLLDSASTWPKEEFISQAVFCFTNRVMCDKELHYPRKAIWKESSAVHLTIVSECSFINSLKIRLKQLGTFTENKPN